jgi:hypothetical protein
MLVLLLVIKSFVFPRSDNVWLVLICSERKALLAGGWADKPNE